MKTLFIALEGFTGPAFRRARELGALPVLDSWCGSGGIADLHFPLADMRQAMLVSTMTGTWPDQHGILTAEIGDPAAKTLRPVTPADRSRPALWELLDDEGVPSLSVGWPLAINGRTSHAAIVSSAFGPAIADPTSAATSAFYPPSLSDTLRECILRPEEVDPAAVGSLMPGWAGVDPSVDARPGLIARILAENVSRHAAFLELIASKAASAESTEEFGDYEFATLCLSLVGEFASLERASESMGDGLLEELSDRGLPLLNAFLDSILETTPPETNLIIAGIPHVETPEAGGFLLISGGAFVAGSLPKSVGITEIAPLVMSSCGVLPASLPTTRLISVLQKDLAFRVSRTERPQHPDTDRPDFHHLLAIESDLQVQPGHSPLPGELWHVTALSALSRSLMARGEFVSALPVLEAQALLLPRNQKAHLLLSECRQRLDLLEEALDSAYAAINPFHGNDPIALLRAAELEALTGRPQKARPLLQQAAAEMGGFPQHRLLQANVLIFLRDWIDAEAILEILAKESPEDAYIRYRLCRCHVARSAWQEALHHAVESIRIEPKRALAHELLGYALHGVGLLEHAKRAFENAAMLSPQWARPKAMLVALARKMGRSQTVIDDLQADYWKTKQESDKQRKMQRESLRSSGKSA
jgi:tetratricopeptide (TPR) repeat protein